MAKTAAFFEEQLEQSQVKTAIVTKYFWAWAKVILGYLKSKGKTSSIGYIDLFAGPGRFKDGSKSTPLLILQQALAEPDFKSNLVTIFNDADTENTSTLAEEIAKIPGIEELKHKPQVKTQEVGDKIVEQVSRWTIPTLFFIDPWGYKGLSLRLINAVLGSWASECIFFFNYNRINMGVPNDGVAEHMAALFGDGRFATLQNKVKDLDPDERELMLVEELCQALVEMGGKYTLPFRFKNAKGSRTSHHLIFVSKHPRGYHIMKEVMANESSEHSQGVPSFEYNLATKRQPRLFELGRPLDELGDMLLKQYAGRTIGVKELYEEHNYGRRFILKNYQKVLSKLELDGKIACDRPYTTRTKKADGSPTFAVTLRVTFPK